jgi:hypothetical protein
MFNDLNRIPFAQTNAGKKKIRLEEAMRQTREDMISESELLRQSKEDQIDVQRGIMAENYGSFYSKRKRRGEFSLRADLTQKLTEDVVVEVMTDILYESIILDETFKESYKKSIEETARAFFKESFSSDFLNMDLFSENTSIVTKDIFAACLESAMETVERLDIDSYNEDTYPKILAEASEKAKSKAKEEKSEVADEVKDKVAKVVKTEKDIAKKTKGEMDKYEDKKDDAAADAGADSDASAEGDSEAEEDFGDDDSSLDEGAEDDSTGTDDLEDSESGDGTEDLEDESSELDDDHVKTEVRIVKKEEKIITKVKKKDDEMASESTMNFFKKDEPTLFRTMMIRNSRKPLSEGENMGVKTNMDLLLAESIIQYTLLETMYTMYLFNPTPAEVISLSKTFKYKS